MPPAPHHRLPPGLYLVTPDEPDTSRLLARVAPLLVHAACLQYRNKAADPTLQLQQAQALQALCAPHGLPLIVNDDPGLAGRAGAAGVHLGADDPAIASARAQLGEAAIIGVSCYDDLSRARAAAAAGADYLAFGAFFPSPTKPNARQATAQLLRDAGPLRLPRVAIGGITPDNAAPLVEAGADLIAVISGVFDAPDPVAAARACRALYS
jgi:thiamine-phosphate pyrophosphorylase